MKLGEVWGVIDQSLIGTYTITVYKTRKLLKMRPDISQYYTKLHLPKLDVTRIMLVFFSVFVHRDYNDTIHSMH